MSKRAYGDHKEFINRLRGKISKKNLRLIDFAYDLAKYGHRQQKRDNGERYFEHCRRTALILIDELQILEPRMIEAALLHDMLEDSFLLKNKRIRLIFGRKTAKMVAALTKPKKTDSRFIDDAARHRFYFENLKLAKQGVKLLKLCDRLTNMREIGNCTLEKQARKIKETIDIYLPLIDDIAVDYADLAEFFVREFAKLGIVPTA